MGTLILLRHGRSTANNGGILAGRSDGVDLDETGAAQAAGLPDRLTGARVAALVSSPLLRCRRTLEPLSKALGLPIRTDDRVAEVDYGNWTGRALKDLAEEPLWRTVQLHPAGAVFPDGEALASVSARAVAAAREYAEAGGDDGAVLLCSHGDVIKAILADALGLHLDQFQRLTVAPASISVVRYTPLRAFVERVNDTGSLQGVGVPPPAEHGADAAVGGDPGRDADSAAPDAGLPTPDDPVTPTPDGSASPTPDASRSPAPNGSGSPAPTDRAHRTLS